MNKVEAHSSSQYFCIGKSSKFITTSFGHIVVAFCSIVLIVVWVITVHVVVIIYGISILIIIVVFTVVIIITSTNCLLPCCSNNNTCLFVAVSFIPSGSFPRFIWVVHVGPLLGTFHELESAIVCITERSVALLPQILCT
jgi:hypothetical protein